MFDFLKKKISAFTEKVKETLQGKGSEGKPQEDSPQAAEHQVARQKEQNETQTFQESKTEVPEKQILQKAAEKEIPAKKARGEIAENKGEKSGPEKEIQGLKKKGEEKGASILISFNCCVLPKRVLKAWAMTLCLRVI